MEAIEEKLGDPKWEGCCDPTFYQPELCPLARDLYFSARMTNYYQTMKTTLDLFACRKVAIQCQKKACRGVFAYVTEMSDCMEQELECYRIAKTAKSRELQQKQTVSHFAAYIGFRPKE